ncbi:hypothetical protein ACTFIZ_002397 [Dictyostelium cf. discoideum]
MKVHLIIQIITYQVGESYVFTNLVDQDESTLDKEEGDWDIQYNDNSKEIDLKDFIFQCQKLLHLPDDHYEVEEIINYNKDKKIYMVKFVGYLLPEWVKEKDLNLAKKGDNLNSRTLESNNNGSNNQTQSDLDLTERRKRGRPLKVKPNSIPIINTSNNTNNVINLNNDIDNSTSNNKTSNLTNQNHVIKRSRGRPKKVKRGRPKKVICF